ncbi:MAG: hypothetical protein E5Y88_22820 [Mesorhizobium sp.]|uniref:hypothetical protein n=1 Tax=Mesorhizobium sp. TaxID=1871066 RepID=UPI000FEA46EA|nr:hypothetical protein [Mesorhizobium sp.]RWQ38388.1 MAG: hypothetical protein EOS20_08945 [Mesorhizobium sp.]TIL23476.1 MAG: hypothetical protein E5Y88_22820 [Mesorhizobium sp.]
MTDKPNQFHWNAMTLAEIDASTCEEVCKWLIFNILVGPEDLSESLISLFFFVGQNQKSSRLAQVFIVSETACGIGDNDCNWPEADGPVLGRTSQKVPFRWRPILAATTLLAVA